MYNALQTIEHEDFLVQGVPQATPIAINQCGYQGSTNIGYVGNLNLNVSALPHFAGNNMTYQPARISNDYFNLFVIENENFNGNYFTIPKDRALTDCIALDIKKRYAQLDGDAVENIKTFPSIFASVNRRRAATDVDHQAYYGFVTNIQLLRNDIKITYRCSYQIPQQRLNEIAADLMLRQAPLANELNDAHWTIKQIDLLDKLRTAGILASVPA